MRRKLYGGTWLSKGDPGLPHWCPVPGAWERWRNKCKPYAVWRCSECLRVWRWESGYDGYEWRQMYNLPTLGKSSTTMRRETT